MLSLVTLSFGGKKPWKVVSQRQQQIKSTEVVVFRTEKLSLNSLLHLKMIHLVQKINDDRN